MILPPPLTLFPLSVLTGMEDNKMPTKQEFEQAEDRVHEWLKGFIEGQSSMAKRLCPMIEQFCRDLNEAHNEILRQQGVPESDFNKYDWPEWSNQANSIRWAENIQKRKLAKTDNWTRYPSREGKMPDRSLNFVSDKLEKSAWDVAKAIQDDHELSNDATSDLHVALLEFATQIQQNAILLCLRQISDAVRNKS